MALRRVCVELDDQRRAALLSARLRQPLLCGREHVFGVGPAGAEEAREHVPAPRGDGFAVDDHVELAGLPDVHRGVDIEAFLDEGNETRRPGLITSIRAVEDLDLHVVSMGVAVSAVEFLVKCRVFYLTSGADALCGRPWVFPKRRPNSCPPLPPASMASVLFRTIPVP